MSNKVSGPFTVRARMNRGTIELLEDAEIEDGSLLDVVVIKPGRQVRLEQQASDRATLPSESIVFSLSRQAGSDDPLKVFSHVPKTRLAKLRFDGYECRPPVVLDDVQLDLVRYVIEVSQPPASVTKLLRGAIRKRQAMECSPGSKTNEQQHRRLRELLEEQIVDDESQLSLWHIAVTAVTSDHQSIPLILSEVPADAAEMELARTSQTPPGGHQEEQVRQELISHHEHALRKVLLKHVVGCVVRYRRALSGATESEKLERRELSELAGRLK